MEQHKSNNTVLDLLKNSVYIISPIVKINEKEEITILPGLHRELYTWFHEESFELAREQDGAMEALLTCIGEKGYSSTSSSLIRNTNRNPFIAKDFLGQFIGEVPYEDAPMIADCFFGQEWPYQRAYDINRNPSEFEEKHCKLIGTIVRFTPSTFERYLNYLKGVRKNILTYLGPKVLQKEFDEFYDSQPKLWWRWGEFMAGEEGEEDYRVMEPYEFAADFVHSAHSLFQDEIKALHEKRKLEFILDSELTLNLKDSN